MIEYDVNYWKLIKSFITFRYTFLLVNSINTTQLLAVKLYGIIFIFNYINIRLVIASMKTLVFMSG